MPRSRLCHSRTRDLATVTRLADILIVAIGRPKFVTADMVKPGAVVVDVGINRTEEGVVGDVDFDAVREVAGAITPVPGGVGPLTIAMLLRNTLRRPLDKSLRNREISSSGARRTVVCFLCRECYPDGYGFGQIGCFA